MRSIFSIFISILFFACAEKKPENVQQAKKAFQRRSRTCKLNRYSTPTNDLVHGGNKSTIGHYNATNKKTYSFTRRKHSRFIKYQFWSDCARKSNTSAISIVNPAILYKISKDGAVQLVYKEAYEKVFYDAITFWNDKEGIAMGDPTDDCISMIIMHDGRNTWQKIACDQVPKVKEGEAVFAASNTNIAIIGNATWIATGGKSNRIRPQLAGSFRDRIPRQGVSNSH